MSYSRKLDLLKATQEKSVFLFGPRGVGKTTLIRDSFGPTTLIVDLLKSRLYTDLSSDPSLLEELIGENKFVVIDEIQRVPELLNEVQRLIEERRIRFLLTGSSARKLKKENANLLGGRARRLSLFPFIYLEVASEFKLKKVLQFGSLPFVFTSKDPEAELDAYLNIYLREEIKAEGMVRNLPAFSRFLKVAALNSGQLINYAAIGSDSSVKETTVRSHYEILDDTLIGFTIEPFVETRKRKAIATGKFYFFDNGIRNFIVGLESLDRHSHQYGICFETFFANELKAYLAYNQVRKALTFWRSTSQFEVDFLIGQSAAIEVKATQKVTEKHLKGLFALSEENIFKHFYLISEDPLMRTVRISKTSQIHIYPWNIFLERLWAGKILL